MKTPQLTIERVGYNGETGKVDYVDLHDESTGMAIMCIAQSQHFHGFNTPKKVATIAPEAQKAPVARHRHTVRPFTPKEVYKELEALPVGATLNATPYVNANVPFRTFADRVYGYVWGKNRHLPENEKRTYTTSRVSGQVLVTRVK
jgi:hypothetical protein